jgi:hypothetical protein
MAYYTAISTYDVVNDIFLTDPEHAVFATYTIDKDYVSTTDRNGRKWLKEGWVMALDPSTEKIVPHYTSYGFGVIGVLPGPVSLENEEGTHDEIVGIVVDNAWLDSDLIFDNGTFGTVTSTTISALDKRIVFAKRI